MVEDYEDELVTSHSDENPELGEGSSKDPLAAHSTEGSAVSELYKKEGKTLLGVKEEEMDRVTDFEFYIPPED